MLWVKERGAFNWREFILRETDFEYAWSVSTGHLVAEHAVLHAVVFRNILHAVHLRHNGQISR